ncbi:MAG: uroporphyrinogen-III synthase [Myxococcota bacterium]
MSALNNVRLLITRPADSVDTWDAAIEERGAVPVHVPLVQSRRVRNPRWTEAVEGIKGLRGDVVVGLASARGAAHWHAALEEAGVSLEVSRTVAVGEATAEKARELGMEVEVATEHNASGLAKSIEGVAAAAATIVLPRAVDGRTEAMEYLKGKGRTVRSFPLYETNPVLKPASADTAPVHWVLSASPSAARAYGWHKAALFRIGLLLPQSAHAVIGATTAAASRSLGISVHAESPEPTIDSILDTLEHVAPVQFPEA